MPIRGGLIMSKSVFLIHGRDLECTDDVRRLLETAGLEVSTFDDVGASLKSGAPFVGEVVQVGVDGCDAVIALFTPDELAALGSSFRRDQDEPTDRLRWQARPNVIFEAGLALGLNAKGTVLVTVGSDVSLFSDLEGRMVRRLDDGRDSKTKLLEALNQIGAELAPEAIEDAAATSCPAIARISEAERRKARDPFGHVGGYDWAFAGTAVVVDDSCRFLLVEHPHHGVLLPPGGRVTDGAKPDEVALARTLTETGYEVELHPIAHPKPEVSGERGVDMLPRPFHVQFESNQRGEIHHYDMLYVARVLGEVKDEREDLDGKLAHDWYALADLEELPSNRIFPNVLELLRAVHRLLTREQ